MEGEMLALRLVRFDNQHLAVVVPSASRVADVKRTVERVVAAAEEPSLGGHRRLSWRHVWKNWTLTCDGRELSDPRALLLALGVSNSSELAFHPRVRIRTRAQRVTSVATARGKKRNNPPRRP